MKCGQPLSICSATKQKLGFSKRYNFSNFLFCNFKRHIHLSQAQLPMISGHNDAVLLPEIKKSFAIAFFHDLLLTSGSRPEPCHFVVVTYASIGQTQPCFTFQNQCKKGQVIWCQWSCLNSKHCCFLENLIFP